MVMMVSSCRIGRANDDSAIITLPSFVLYAAQRAMVGASSAMFYVVEKNRASEPSRMTTKMMATACSKSIYVDVGCVEDAAAVWLM